MNQHISKVSVPNKSCCLYSEEGDDDPVADIKKGFVEVIVLTSTLKDG